MSYVALNSFILRRFVHVSTDEVYGENVDGLPFTEDAAFHPTNPYAATKAAAEMLMMV